ncbi:unnamed protein product [Microthlaspi erraticum]|uniref:Uncharacterized protein n=1 Tax=Microthlaspi erraticum TaxID=1685480 RepID=A0A6D2JLJ5_9BRAS|nr:unnamed protein product [Microthlaspi erraticum]
MQVKAGLLSRGVCVWSLGNPPCIEVLDSLKRSYNQKSGDCPDGSIENQRPTAQSGWPRNYCFTLGQISSVRLKSRPKSKPFGRPQSRPGKLKPAVGHATTSRHSRARPCARAGKQRLAAAQLSRVPRRRSVRPGNYVPRPAERFHRPSLHPSDQRPTTHPSGPDRRSDTATTRFRPIVPTDRPNAAVDPKPVLKPDFIFSRPGLTLSRLKRPSTIYIAF